MSLFRLLWSILANVYIFVCFEFTVDIKIVIDATMHMREFERREFEQSPLK